MKFIIAGLIIVYACLGLKIREEASNAYIRDRVFLLTNADHNGSCTGVQILGAASHKPVLLTAAHCKGLLQDGHMIAVDEQKGEHVVDFIEEDPKSDLLVLTAATDKFIPVADSIALYDAVHTLTHGKGLPTYRTDGEALNTEIPYMPIPEEDVFTCEKMPKYIVEMFSCVLISEEMVTTAQAAPGSSGGPLLDESGALVGIVSGRNQFTTVVVQLKDIQAFLKDK